MFGFVKQLVAGWANWIGDRDLELALRKHLNDSGYYGDSARFKNLRLVAVQRPGWLQLFAFSAEVRAVNGVPGECVSLYGIVRQDERYERVDVRVFHSPLDRNAQFEDWSKDLVRLRTSGL